MPTAVKAVWCLAMKSDMASPVRTRIRTVNSVVLGVIFYIVILLRKLSLLSIIIEAMNHLVTPELYDSLLNFLLKNVALGEVEDFESEQSPIPVPEGISNAMLTAILEFFRDSGFIGLHGYGSNVDSYLFGISISVKAIDYQRHGGFVGQEVLFKQNIEKLLLELEDLKPSSAEKAEKITTIVANIGSFLGMAFRMG